MPARNIGCLALHLEMRIPLDMLLQHVTHYVVTQCLSADPSVFAVLAVTESCSDHRACPASCRMGRTHGPYLQSHAHAVVLKGQCPESRQHLQPRTKQRYTLLRQIPAHPIRRMQKEMICQSLVHVVHQDAFGGFNSPTSSTECPGAASSRRQGIEPPHSVRCSSLPILSLHEWTDRNTSPAYSRFFVS